MPPEYQSVMVGIMPPGIQKRHGGHHAPRNSQSVMVGIMPTGITQRKKDA